MLGVPRHWIGCGSEGRASERLKTLSVSIASEHRYHRSTMIGPFAFIIGAMKCGTTALFESLIQHPEICGCSQKEPNYFSHAALQDRSFESYTALYPWDDRRHRVALEASTSYTKMPSSPGGANQIYFRGLDDARFIYVVRDPIQRIRSDYLHSLDAGWVKAPITEGVEPDRVAYSNYAFQILPYEYYFGRDRILVVAYNQLRTSRAELLRRICEFIGVDPTFRFPETGPRNNSTDYKRSLFLKTLEQSGLECGKLARPKSRGQSFEQLLQQCRSLTRNVDERVRLEELARELPLSYTPSKEQAESIREVLADDLARFSSTWGVDPWQSG